MKWTAAATAPNEPIGESWAILLRERSIPAYVRKENLTAYLGSSFIPVRVMVPEDRLSEAKVILNEFVGSDKEQP